MKNSQNKVGTNNNELLFKHRFTKQVDDVICLTADTLNSYGHSVFTPSHFLLGLLTLDEHLANKILKELINDLEKFISRTIEDIKNQENIPSGSKDALLSKEMVSVTYLAGELANDLGSFPIGTEHFLLALLNAKAGNISELLAEAGLTANKIEELIDRYPKNPLYLDPLSNQDIELEKSIKEKGWRRYLNVVSPVFLGLILATALAGVFTFQNYGFNQLIFIIFIVGGWVTSLCLHEFGHALSAFIGGDYSVVKKGYLSLNPIKYSHPMLSIVLPVLFMFSGSIGLPGGAVYIETKWIKKPYFHSLISAAGPFANASLTILLSIPFLLGWAENTQSNFLFWVGINTLLYLQISALFINLLPTPGLDGYGIIRPFLPKKILQYLNTININSYTLVILFALFFTENPIRKTFWMWINKVMFQMGGNIEFAQIGFSLIRIQ